MNTFERSEASENESYRYMMNFEMLAAAKCDRPSEASRFGNTFQAVIFLTGSNARARR